MKLKSIKKKIWSIVIIITTLIGILPVQANTTETPVKDVELDGRWDDPIRSAATNCPITVFTDGYLLTLKNASPDRDMTIRITDMAKGGAQSLPSDSSFMLSHPNFSVNHFLMILISCY